MSQTGYNTRSQHSEAVSGSGCHTLSQYSNKSRECETGYHTLSQSPCLPGIGRVSHFRYFGLLRINGPNIKATAVSSQICTDTCGRGIEEEITPVKIKLTIPARSEFSAVKSPLPGRKIVRGLSPCTLAGRYRHRWDPQRAQYRKQLCGSI